METIKNLWFDGHRIFMRSSEGRVLSRPLEAYPELEEATTENWMLTCIYRVSMRLRNLTSRTKWLPCSGVVRG